MPSEIIGWGKSHLGQGTGVESFVEREGEGRYEVGGVDAGNLGAEQAGAVRVEQELEIPDGLSENLGPGVDGVVIAADNHVTVLFGGFRLGESHTRKLGVGEDGKGHSGEVHPVCAGAAGEDVVRDDDALAHRGVEQHALPLTSPGAHTEGLVVRIVASMSGAR